MNISISESTFAQKRYGYHQLKETINKSRGTIVSLRISKDDGIKQALESLIKASTVGVVGYYDTGLALTQIKTSELYKPEFLNFYRYCQDTFGLSESRIKQFIRAVKVTDSVEAVARENNISLNEGLCRELHKIKDIEARSQCLKIAAQKGRITAKTLHQEYRTLVLEKSSSRELPEIPKTGTVVRLSTKNNPELCPFNQLWGIVQDEFDLSVSVAVLGINLESVHPRELIISDDLNTNSTFADNLLERLNAIYKSYDAPAIAKEICKLIGSRPLPFLEKVEDKILTTIEQQLNLI